MKRRNAAIIHKTEPLAHNGVPIVSRRHRLSVARDLRCLKLLAGNAYLLGHDDQKTIEMLLTRGAGSLTEGGRVWVEQTLDRLGLKVEAVPEPEPEVKPGLRAALRLPLCPPRKGQRVEFRELEELDP